MGSSLKQFIKAVRSAKTIADEKRVIQTESAAIRTSFREESSDHNKRRNNVSKLLFLFTLGEKTHFGQIECLKLLASPKFADKRLGYLGAMLLLDENQEVLTLVTNSLQSDLNSSNQYCVGLALCTLGNIASPEMARDLFSDVEKLLGSSNAYLRKKAALAAMRIVKKKVPELQENFVDRAKILVGDRNNGVVVASLSMMIDFCEEDPDIIPEFRPLVPQLVKILKTLNSTGLAPEYEIQGISDPFLQTKILRLLAYLGRDDAEVSEQMNDVLAQVCSNTESSKNVGNAILYEAVLTILEIEADSGLRVLGVNILGKFLGNRDNNIRYVALNTLTKVVEIEPNAIQRHRSTILDCLRDPDISIRRRALDLAFSLINENNIRVLIKELLSFLEIANAEFKINMTTQICVAADRFAPSRRWHVDTVLRVLKIAGNHIREQILASVIRLFAISTELQDYTTRKLYLNLRSDNTQEGMTIAGAWVIGEYGDMLFRTMDYEEPEMKVKVEEEELVSMFENILFNTNPSEIICEYVLTALVKLSARFKNEAQIARIKSILDKFARDLNVELQQRSSEYNRLFGFNDIRSGVLERMPLPEIKEEKRVLGTAATKTRTQKKKTKQEELMDLIGISEDLSNSNDTMAPSKQDTNNADLLSGVFDTNNDAVAKKPDNKYSDILGLFGNEMSGSKSGTPHATTPAADSGMDYFSGNSTGQAASNAHAEIQAYQNGGFSLWLQPQAADPSRPGQASVTASFRNSGPQELTNVNLEAAVPRSMKLKMMPLSSTTLAPNGGSASQTIRIQASKEAQIKLRLRISFQRSDGSECKEQIDFNKFPPNLIA